MVPIKEALTFDDVTMAPKYSEVLPSEVNTSTQLSKNLLLLPFKILLRFPGSGLKEDHSSFPQISYKVLKVCSYFNLSRHPLGTSKELRKFGKAI